VGLKLFLLAKIICGYNFIYFRRCCYKARCFYKKTRKTTKNRDRIYANFKKYSIESKTNFVLLKFEDADFVYNQLFSEGIVTRKYNEELKQFIRVTVGNEYETKTFIKALSNILKKL
jgi:histidinol-phosphate aminotransferase